MNAVGIMLARVLYGLIAVFVLGAWVHRKVLSLRARWRGRLAVTSWPSR